ncbi:MAG: hypothetical protein HPZ91_13610 [Lentisphaeria bacterium]|nr:hypothetical protein [Lentisphaeria bacterium]
MISAADTYRMASWWITWRDLDWPSSDNFDRIRRRADEMSEACVDVATVFGAHFRWDFLPVWTVLHDYMATVAQELHRRGIRFFDHHSAVLVHRYEGRGEMRNMKLHSGPHLPFAPSRSAAAGWEFRGRRLNDWRMIDVETGKVLQLPCYAAEEFCFSNPEFVESYLEYLHLLLAETGVDGLMCDDPTHFSGFRSCGCDSCRAVFRERTGSELPPPDDERFWGDWNNPLWNAWIDQRFDANGSFLEHVRSALPEGFPLMSCCSGSSGAGCAAVAQDVREFNRGCSLVHLELCGNTPPWRSDPHTWNIPVAERLSAALHHCGAAQERGLECVGQGYGFTAPSAEIIWALNKTAGAACWFSTLKGRLGLPDAILDTLPGDAEPAARVFRYEKEHPELFRGRPAARFGVLFPYETRNHTCFGSMANGCAKDFGDTIRQLFQLGVSAGVVLEVPDSTDRYSLLIVPSAARLTGEERARLRAFAAAGGHVLATGPFGFDGCETAWDLPMKAPEFRTGAWRSLPVPPLPEAPGWRRVAPGVEWNPARLQDGTLDLEELVAKIERYSRPLPFAVRRAEGYLAVPHRGENGEYLIHFLAEEYETQIDAELDRMRVHRSRVNLITAVAPAGTGGSLEVETALAAEAFAPLNGKQPRVKRDGAAVTVELPEPCSYVICRLRPEKEEK